MAQGLGEKEPLYRLFQKPRYLNGGEKAVNVSAPLFLGHLWIGIVKRRAERCRGVCGDESEEGKVCLAENPSPDRYALTPRDASLHPLPTSNRFPHNTPEFCSSSFRTCSLSSFHISQYNFSSQGFHAGMSGEGRKTVDIITKPVN